MLARSALKRRLATLWWEVARHRSRDAAPILCYHTVSPVPGPLMTVALEAFEAQIAHLAAHFEVRPLEGFVDALLGGAQIAGQAVVTFDDAFADHYVHVLPILTRYRCPATFFVPTAFVGRGDRVTWNQLRAMRAAGCTIGAHGHTHRRLRGLTPEELHQEVVRPKALLEEELRSPVSVFAYPYGQRGDFDGATVESLRGAGYAAACSTIWGTRSTPRKVFSLRRIVIDATDDMETFRLKLGGAYDYLGLVGSMRPWRDGSRFSP